MSIVSNIWYQSKRDAFHLAGEPCYGSGLKGLCKTRRDHGDVSTCTRHIRYV